MKKLYLDTADPKLKLRVYVVEELGSLFGPDTPDDEGA